MTGDVLAEPSWPASRLGELLALIGKRARLALHEEPPAPITRAVLEAGGDALERWLEATCEAMGFEAEPISMQYRDVDATLSAIAPAVIRLPGAEPRFVGVLAARGNHVVVVGSDHRRHRIARERLRAVLCEANEREVAPLLERLGQQIPHARRQRALAQLRRELLADTRVGGGFLLRMSPGAPTWRQLRDAGFTRRVGKIFTLHVLQYVSWLASWWMLGRGALAGHLELGWILAWALLLATSHALRVVVLRAEARVAIDVGALLKQRLLLGTLRVSPDQVRGDGIGQSLGRVFESEAVESLALGGGLIALEATMELLAAPFILWLGAGGGLHVALLAIVVVALVVYARSYYRRRSAWTDTRIAMTNDLVESMVAHRTRIVQEPVAEWNHAADHELEVYLERGKQLDRDAVRLRAAVGRGWLLLGIAGCAPAFITGRADATALALALGGVLLAMRALQRLSVALVQLTAAAVSARQISALYRAAARREAVGVPSFAVAPSVAESIIEAHEITFRYDERAEPAIDDVTLAIAAGDRILLEGPSGGGKSTLAALLSGMRVPQHGVLLIGGLDRATLGARGWRRRVTTAPQFHENHVLAESFAFNLLMGRAWPPDPEAAREAHAICTDLGLDALLARMPAGMMQMVGDTGWQLSHGERSRLYIARALLQRADVVIFDESFGALDPENVRRALECVLARARSLVVIAHP